MKSARLVLFVVIGLIQLSVPASVIWKREQTLRHGRTWKFKTAPVDPVDAIRGRYVALGFDAEKFPAPDPNPDLANVPGSIVYAKLKEGPDGFAVVDQISAERLKGDDVLKVEKRGWYDDFQHVSFPFN